MNREVRVLLILSSPLVTWGVLFLAFRFGGLTLPKLLPWVKFLTLVGIVVWAVLIVLGNPERYYVDAYMGVVYALWLAVWWVERRSKARG